MFSVLSRRTLAIAAVAAALVGTAACGPGADTRATCAEAQKIMTEFPNKLSASVADPASFNKATDELAADLKALADKSDGDLAGALTDLSTLFGAVKIDASNPAAATAKLTELSTNAQNAAVKLGQACT
ncbi:hypothetical protein GCM10023259_037730 [Thermocatellispora tengchongensis]